MNTTGYTELPTVSENAQETPKPTDAEALLMRRSAGIVFIVAFFQLAMTVFSAGPDKDDWVSIVVPIVCGLFAFFGIVGSIRKRPCLLIAHFIYSLACYIFTVVAFIYIVLNYWVDVWGYLVGFGAMLLQAFGLRHSRILIGLTRKFNPSKCCRRSCKGRNACQKTVSAEAATATVGVNTAAADVAFTPAPPAEPFQMNPQMYAYQYQQPMMMMAVPAEYLQQHAQFQQGAPLRYPMMYAPAQGVEAPAHQPQMYPAMYRPQ